MTRPAIRQASKTVQWHEYSADLHRLARVNRGAREAMLIGYAPEAVLYYATQWPHGIGVGERSGR